MTFLKLDIINTGNQQKGNKEQYIPGNVDLHSSGAGYRHAVVAQYRREKAQTQ
jgi:hypothetical protein